MKFLCDRCKTRYSISDDRVRGKILKIRCKSCANVITVREGMPPPEEADAAPPGAAGVRRAHKTTIAAPVAQSEAPAPEPAPAPAPRSAGAAAPAPGSALGAAFASAMVKPPPALEQDWYVSIEGDQAGPFSLADAQRWVAGKPPDAELHCWSEGFDDWLPVDKVSHFRGLRKKAAPPPPTPPAFAPPAAAVQQAQKAQQMQRTVTRPGTPAALRGTGARTEPLGETPPPTFASTMAQLERGTPASELRGPGARLANGAAPLPGRAGLTSSLASAQPSPLGARGAAPLGPSGAARGRGGDVNDDSATQLESGLADSATRIEPAVVARAAALRQRRDANDDSATQLEPGLADLGTDPDGVASPGDSGAISGDDDLDIGEVSRVVNLGDLAREAAHAPVAPWPMPAPADPPAFVAARAAAAARLEAMRPPGAPGPGPFASGPGEVALLPMPELAPSPAAVSHRRALIALIAGALVLVGVAVAVVFFVLTGEDDGGSRLGEVEEIDTTRPDEVRTSGSGSGGSGTVATGEPSPNPFVPRPPKRPGGGGSTVTSPVTPGTPSDVGKLEAREIEEMAGKNSTVTQRCYMRAQRGAEGILIGDVKKIAVTLTINGDGQVTEALLSDNHAQNSLGRCLIGAIKLWKFRPSPGGTFRFVLHFG